MTDWDSTVDVLVAGSGGGGVTGAYTAAREGLEVLLVEATDKFGGTTAYSGGGGVWFPCNPVLQRAGTDDTIEDALEYYHAVVGDRTPRELQDTYVRGGAPLMEYLEADPNIKFDMLPWPDYFGKMPKARLDGQRHVAARPLKIEKAPEFKELVRGPLDNDRLGVPQPDDYFIGGRALIARFLVALKQYPSATTQLNTALVELVTEDGAVVGAVVETTGSARRSGHARACCSRPAALRATTSCGASTACPAKRGTPWGPGAIWVRRMRRASPWAPTPI